MLGEAVAYLLKEPLGLEDQSVKIVLGCIVTLLTKIEFKAEFKPYVRQKSTDNNLSPL